MRPRLLVGKLLTPSVSSSRFRYSYSFSHRHWEEGWARVILERRRPDTAPHSESLAGRREGRFLTPFAARC